MAKERFHYYAQQSVRGFVEPLDIKRWMRGGDAAKAPRLKFQSMAKRGRAVSYLAVMDSALAKIPIFAQLEIHSRPLHCLSFKPIKEDVIASKSQALGNY